MNITNIAKNSDFLIVGFLKTFDISNYKYCKNIGIEKMAKTQFVSL